MERFGRRTPLIIGGLWQSAWLFVYGAAGTARDPLTDQGIGKRESLFNLSRVDLDVYGLELFNLYPFDVLELDLFDPE